jgi:hypothetical protein
MIVKQTRLLESPGDQRNAWTMDAKHVGQILLGQLQFIPLYPVMAKQDPSSETLLGAM